MNHDCEERISGGRECLRRCGDGWKVAEGYRYHFLKRLT